ncbi:UNVERIFIED_CONTAM: hypothetical protein HDU68_003013 [Siphonaria sp. JEL0065]|nr:hypothetical protein HDU68_003013 [Siphonaria sp. JEL0065]
MSDNALRCFNTGDTYSSAWFAALKDRHDGCSQSVMDAMIPYQRYNIVLSAPGLPVLTPSPSPPPPPPPSPTIAVVVPSFIPGPGPAITTANIVFDPVPSPVLSSQTVSSITSKQTTTTTTTTTITTTTSANIQGPTSDNIDAGTVLGLLIGLVAIFSLVLLCIKKKKQATEQMNAMEDINAPYQSFENPGLFYGQVHPEVIVVVTPAPSPIPSPFNEYSEKSSHVLNEHVADSEDDATATGSMFDVYRPRPASLARFSVDHPIIPEIHVVDADGGVVAVTVPLVSVEGYSDDTGQLLPPAYEYGET